MDQNARAGEKPITIKKYANRRLYNTATSSYVTLDDLAAMVKLGSDFAVFDAKSGEDITRSVLTQIIFEEENKGDHNLLPIRFLRQLIRYYGDNMQTVVPRYLEFSIEALVREQEKIQKQFSQTLGVVDPFKAIEEQTRHNIAMFEKAMSMFNPFAVLAGTQGPAGEVKAAEEVPEREASSRGGGGTDEMRVLREQLSAMQRQIDGLAKGKK
ncbi:polyhydroxyalkanoate synthesis repressor PhaR [Rhodoligotrophos appendicifer]|uniref:polyhydroxyalkanoate synthesis repressor PhaR n=1 Tax=Rhodoligotrophos appendicifer TaxID=987056 RepID=UPI001184D1C3|nr:polyhydroxyalkanoate synthesis repressor PhaR [Rhodoligotrophos appendicifer]